MGWRRLISGCEGRMRAWTGTMLRWEVEAAVAGPSPPSSAVACFSLVCSVTLVPRDWFFKWPEAAGTSLTSSAMAGLSMRRLIPLTLVRRWFLAGKALQRGFFL